jgi:myo-inositol-1(or 4)-monophosphatase
MPTDPLTRYAEAAERAARAAGALLRRHLGKPRTVAVKRSAVDLVTNVDRASERLIAGILHQADPAIGFLGEERGERTPDSPDGCRGARWIVDPLDGTMNFVHGLPLFGVSIALQAQWPSDPTSGRVTPWPSGRRTRSPGHEAAGPLGHWATGPLGIVVGVIYDPMQDELFLAITGGGAFLNGRRIRVSSTTTLSKSLLSTGFPSAFRSDSRPYLRWFHTLQRGSHGVRRLGSTVVSLAAVAAGRLEGFYEQELRSWDIAAGVLLVQEAGGQVSDLTGRALISLEDGRLVASNGRIHRPLVRALHRPR